MSRSAGKIGGLPGRPLIRAGFALALLAACFGGNAVAATTVAGNLPMVSEIAPFLFVAKLDGFDDAGGTAIAVVLLLASFAALLAINLVQLWTVRRYSAEAR